MGEVVNLRQARKRFARKTAEVKAAENRIRFGQTKSEKRLQREEADRQSRSIDGARRIADDKATQGKDD